MSQENYEIKYASMEDADLISTLFVNNCLSEISENLINYDLYLLFKQEFTKRWVEKLSSNYRVLLIKSAEVLLGMVSFTHANKHLEITEICTHLTGAFHVEKILIDTLIAKEVPTKISMWVNTQNQSLQTLLLKLDFIETEKIMTEEVNDEIVFYRTLFQLEVSKSH